MPQTFQVLRCYKCFVFQVHLTKKANKWECKICGEKQSIKRHYGVGNAKDCRIHVQKLNSMRGEINELKCGLMQRNAKSDDESDSQPTNYEQEVAQTKLLKESKWNNYIEEPEIIDNATEPMCIGNAEVVLETPKKRRKQFQNSSSKYHKDRGKNYYCALQETHSNNTHQSLPCNNQRTDCDVSKKFLGAKELLLDVPSRCPAILKESPILNVATKKLNVSKQKFVPPVINKNSKWAQFAEDEEEDVSPSQSIDATQSDLLFSLCDDNELDNVLDIL